MVYTALVPRRRYKAGKIRSASLTLNTLLESYDKNPSMEKNLY